MKSVVVCGHELTAQAGSEMLDKGGNAFDAVVAASFASTVTEPMLTSLAGGGIGLLRSEEETKCIDFLTSFPKSGHGPPVEPIKKIVNFGDEKQVFYMGHGSIGVPGVLDGLLYIHKKYCTLELSDILAPAIKYAKGHKFNKLQEFISCDLLGAFCLFTEKSREVFAPTGRLLKEGEVIRNLKLSRFFEMLAEDEKKAMSFYLESVKESIEEQPCTLSMDDINSYKIKEHEPIEITYRDHDLLLTPPPSAGGLLIAHGLKFMEPFDVGQYEHNSIEHLKILVKTTQECDSKRTQKFFKNLLYEENFWQKFLKKPERLGGTTQISVIDKDGNAAGLTTSNGQGAGVMIGDTGIMFNNFAAEPDLMQYKDIYKPGERITTMMCPTIVSQGGKIKAVLGSGGSNRIRSAIMQSISNLIDFKMSPHDAANASRVHHEAGLLQVEYGIKKDVADALAKDYKTNVWTEKNLFFGGVHMATPDQGGGDARRDGTVIIK